MFATLPVPVHSSPLSDAASADLDRLLHEPATRCLNCGAVLPGAFCPACGQKADPVRQPLPRVLGETFTEMFGLDGRLWRSLGSLLFRPGRLTQAYFAGQRVRYLRPLRLYLTATLAFFFLLSVLDPVGRIEQQIGSDAESDTLVSVSAALAAVDAEIAAPRATGQAIADSVRRAMEASGLSMSRREIEAAVPDSAALEAEAPVDADDVAERHRLEMQRTILASLPPDSLVRLSQVERAALAVYPDTLDIQTELPSWMLQSAAVRNLKTATTRAEKAAALSTLLRTSISKVPTVMFLLLPLFALLLKLLYARRDWYYAEHLVFALHVHAFAFFVFALFVGLIVLGDGAGWSRSVTFSVTSVGIPLYFLVAQKRVYGQGWGKTLLKAVVLAVLYNVVLTFGLVAAVVLAAAQG